MNKELKALERVRNFMSNNAVHWKQDIAMIESALKETEKLKECYKNELKNVSYYNNLALKYKKAVEIIKEKCQFFNLYGDGEEHMCPKGHYRVYDNELYQFNELTKEEYELLKEVLL